MDQILCMGERNFFPKDEFENDEYGNSIHFKNLRIKHYALTGLPVDPHTHPVPETFAALEELKGSIVGSLRFEVTPGR